MVPSAEVPYSTQEVALSSVVQVTVAAVAAAATAGPLTIRGGVWDQSSTLADFLCRQFFCRK